MSQLKTTDVIARVSLLAMGVSLALSCGQAQASYLDPETDEVVVVADNETQGMLGSSDNKVNYGDPTASYKGIGLTRSYDAWRLNGVYGDEEGHIGQIEAGSDRDKNVSYRARYFNVDQDSGFGWSVDFLGHNGKHSDAYGGLAGVVQKYELSSNIMLVPMLSAGYGKLYHDLDDNKSKESSFIAQPGVYMMYGFDQGHWLYLNPKSSYVHQQKAWSAELEVGGGYMIKDNFSVGFKYEVSRFQGKTEDKGWFNLYHYF